MIRERKRPLDRGSLEKLSRLLEGHGVGGEDIDRGVDYAIASGARTLKEGFVLAMSRINYSDEELAAGARFTFQDGA